MEQVSGRTQAVCNQLGRFLGEDMYGDIDDATSTKFFEVDGRSRILQLPGMNPEGKGIGFANFPVILGSGMCVDPHQNAYDTLLDGAIRRIFPDVHREEAKVYAVILQFSSKTTDLHLVM